MKQLAIIVDRDGTAASIHNGPAHRSKDADWQAFNAAIRFDRPVPEVVALLRSIRPGVARIMVSGRAEGQYGKTDLRLAMLDWIHKFDLPIDHLFMRRAGDRRLDSVVKEEILVNQILPHFNPVVAVDDRPQVLEVWEKYGIVTVKVSNPGDLPLIGEYPRYWSMPAVACIPDCKLDPKHVGCCFR